LLLTRIRDRDILPPHERTPTLNPTCDATQKSLLALSENQPIVRERNPVTAQQRVLVVDGLSETEEVLRAVLEPRGLSVDRIRSAGADELASKRRPSVMVLHVDEDPAPAAAPAGWQNVPRIVIGSTKVHDACETATEDHYLEQPFQYGELIRTIERLLSAADAA
jgi:CheY-like chemotaxis protein